MNTFLRLSLFTLVCLSFALMLVGNTAYAQEVPQEGPTMSTTLFPIEPAGITM